MYLIDKASEFHLDGIHCASVERCEVGCRVLSLSHTESHSQLPLTLMQCSVLYHNLTINNSQSTAIMMMAKSESMYSVSRSLFRFTCCENINKIFTLVTTSGQTISISLDSE